MKRIRKRLIVCILVLSMVMGSSPIDVQAKTKKVTSVSITKPITDTLSLQVKQKYQIKAAVFPKNATNKKLKFSSSKKSVASITSKGKILAKSEGTTVIKAVSVSNKKVSASIKLTVVKKLVKVNKITLNSEDETLYINSDDEEDSTFELEAAVKPQNATNKSVDFLSSNKEVATVTSSGKITAKSVGKAEITVCAADGQGAKNTCDIIVEDAGENDDNAVTPVPTSNSNQTENKNNNNGATTPPSTKPSESPTATPTATPVETPIATPTVTPVVTVSPSPIEANQVMLEDFNDDTIGNYLNFTYGGRNIAETGAKMELVQDPADATNKLLKVTIANNTAIQNSGYEFAPIISVDLNKIDATKGTTLDDYSQLSFKTRVVSTGDNVYKRCVGYFAPYGALNVNYSFSSYDLIKDIDDTATKLYKQMSVKTPMLRCKATMNADGTYTDVSSDSINAFMPMNRSADGKPNDKGYSETNHTVPLVQRTLQFYKGNMSWDSDGDRIKELDMTKESKFDLALGATYPEVKAGESTVWYLDDITLTKRTDVISASGITATPSYLYLNTGKSGSIVAKLIPDQCTDSIIYSSSDTSIAEVDTAGNVTAKDKEGAATITMVAKNNPLIKTTCIVYVVNPNPTNLEIPVTKDNSTINSYTSVFGMTDGTGSDIVFGDTDGDGVVNAKNSSGIVTPKYSAVCFNVPSGKNDLSKYKCIRFTGKVTANNLLNGGQVYKFTVAAIKKGVTNSYQESDGTKTRISEKYIDIDLSKDKQYDYITFDKATGEFTADIVFDGDLFSVGSIMISSNSDDTAGLTLKKITCIPYGQDEKDARETYPYLTLPYTQNFESSAITSDSFYMAGDLAYTYNDKTAALGASSSACITVPKNDYNGPAFLISNYKGTADKSFYVTAKFKAADKASFDKPVYLKGGNNLEKINNANVVWATSYLKNDWGVMSAKITLKPGEFSEVRIMSTSGNFLLDDLEVKEYTNTDVVQIDYPDKEQIQNNDIASNVSVDLSKVTGYNSATGAVDLSFSAQYAETKIALPSPVQLALYDSVTVSMAATGNVALKYYDEDGADISKLVRYSKKSDTVTGRDTWLTSNPSVANWNGVDLTTKIAAVGIMANDGACTASITSIFATPSDTVKADLSKTTGYGSTTSYDTATGVTKITFANQYAETKFNLPISMRLAVIDSITVNMANAIGTKVALRYYDEEGLDISGLVRYSRNTDTATGRDTWAPKVWNGVDITTKVAAVGIMSNDGAGSVDISSIYVTPSDVLTADLSKVTGYDSATKAANLTFATQYAETKIALPAATTLSQLKSITVKMSNAVGTSIALKYYDQDGNEINELVRYYKKTDTVTGRDTWTPKIWNNADTTKKVAAVGIMAGDGAGSVTINGITAEIDR